MIKRLTCYSYDTKFSAMNNDTEKIEIPFSSYACFSGNVGFYRKVKGDYTYTIQILTEETKETIEKKASGQSNYSFIQDANDIKLFIEAIKEVIPDTKEECMTLLDCIQEEGSFTIKVSIKGTNLYHRVVLAWIRHLYEPPMNMYSFEALRLFKSGFESIPIVDLFNLCARVGGMTITNHSWIYNENCCVPRMTVGNSVTELYKTLSKIEASEVCSLFKVRTNNSYLRSIIKLTTEDTNSVSWWLNEEKFNMRKDLYVVVYVISGLLSIYKSDNPEEQSSELNLLKSILKGLLPKTKSDLYDNTLTIKNSIESVLPATKLAAQTLIHELEQTEIKNLSSFQILKKELLNE